MDRSNEFLVAAFAETLRETRGQVFRLGGRESQQDVQFVPGKLGLQRTGGFGRDGQSHTWKPAPNGVGNRRQDRKRKTRQDADADGALVGRGGGEFGQHAMIGVDDLAHVAQEDLAIGGMASMTSPTLCLMLCQMPPPPPPSMTSTAVASEIATSISMLLTPTA